MYVRKPSLSWAMNTGPTRCPISIWNQVLGESDRAKGKLYHVLGGRTYLPCMHMHTIFLTLVDQHLVNSYHVVYFCIPIKASIIESFPSMHAHVSTYTCPCFVWHAGQKTETNVRARCLSSGCSTHTLNYGRSWILWISSLLFAMNNVKQIDFITCRVHHGFNHHHCYFHNDHSNHERTLLSI